MFDHFTPGMDFYGDVEVFRQGTCGFCGTYLLNMGCNVLEGTTLDVMVDTVRRDPQYVTKAEHVLSFVCMVVPAFGTVDIAAA